MKILSRLALFLSLLAFAVSPALAQSTVTINTSLPANKQIDYGTLIQVTFDIPKNMQNNEVLKAFRFFVASDNNNSQGVNQGVIGIRVERNTLSDPVQCKPLDFSDTNSDPYNNASFTDQGNGTCRFSVQVDTAKVGATQNSTTTQKYWLRLQVVNGSFVDNGGVYFEIKPKNNEPCSVWQINYLTDKASGTKVTAVRPNQEIGVYLTNMVEGYYYFYFTEDKKLESYCNGGGCSPSTYVTVPETPSAPLTLFVQGPNNTSCTKTLTVADVTPVDDTVNDTIPPTNTPTPTPTPPTPPCLIGENSDGELIDLRQQPSRAQEMVKCVVVATALQNINTDPESVVQAIFAILLSISGGLVLLIIIYSGYQLLTSQGDPEKIKEARERITSAIVGLLFLIFSLIILEIIGIDLLRIPGLQR